MEMAYSLQFYLQVKSFLRQMNSVTMDMTPSSSSLCKFSPTIIKDKSHFISHLMLMLNVDKNHCRPTAVIFEKCRDLLHVA